MTEKRFRNEDNCWGYYTEIIDEQKGLDLSIPNPKKNLTIEELVDLLNELCEENKQLKTKNNAYLQDIEIFKEENTHLKLKNNQLKKELKDYHNTFDCSQCRYQNYDWFDDGDEFEVCDKGNNEAQMDNHSCKDWEEL